MEVTKVLTHFYNREHTKISMFGSKALENIYKDFIAGEKDDDVSLSERIVFSNLRSFSQI